VRQTITHFASPSFWVNYEKLPKATQKLADKNYLLLKENPKYPSIHFKYVGGPWSARVGNRYRALATEVDDGFLWFWIGTHEEYNKLLN